MPLGPIKVHQLKQPPQELIDKAETNAECTGFKWCVRFVSARGTTGHWLACDAADAGYAAIGVLHYVTDAGRLR